MRKLLDGHRQKLVFCARISVEYFGRLGRPPRV